MIVQPTDPPIFQFSVPLDGIPGDGVVCVHQEPALTVRYEYDFLCINRCITIVGNAFTFTEKIGDHPPTEYTGEVDEVIQNQYYQVVFRRASDNTAKSVSVNLGLGDALIPAYYACQPWHVMFWFLTAIAKARRIAL